MYARVRYVNVFLGFSDCGDGRVDNLRVPDPTRVPGAIVRTPGLENEMRERN